MKKIIFLSLVALVGDVWAEVTVYSPSGTITGSYTTIQQGVNACETGGTVTCADGNYEESVKIYGMLNLCSLIQ